MLYRICLISLLIIQILGVSISWLGWKHTSWPFSVDPTLCWRYIQSAPATAELPPHRRKKPPRPALTEPPGQPTEKQNEGKFINMTTYYRATQRILELFFHIYFQLPVITSYKSKRLVAARLTGDSHFGNYYCLFQWVIYSLNNLQWQTRGKSQFF